MNAREDSFAGTFSSSHAGAIGLSHRFRGNLAEVEPSLREAPASEPESASHSLVIDRLTVFHDPPLHGLVPHDAEQTRSPATRTPRCAHRMARQRPYPAHHSGESSVGDGTSLDVPSADANASH